MGAETIERCGALPRRRRLEAGLTPEALTRRAGSARNMQNLEWA